MRVNFAILSWLVLSLAALVSQNSYAQGSGNSPVKRLILSVGGETVTPESLEPGAGKEKSPSLFERGFSKDEIHSCIVASCGPASMNYSGERALTARMNESENFKTLWRDEFVHTMTQTVEMDRSNTLQTLDRIENLLKSQTELKFGHAFQAILASTRLKEKVQTTLRLAVDFDYNRRTAKINPDKLKSALIDTPKKEATAIRLLIKELYEPLLKNFFAEPVINRLGDRLAKKYPQLSPLQAMKRDGQTALDQSVELKKNVGGFFSQQLIADSTFLVLSRAAKGEDLDKLDSETYMEAIDTLSQWSPIFKGALFVALIAVPIDLKQSLATLRVSNSIERQRQKELSETVEQRVSRIAGYCRPRLGLALASTASGFRYRRAEKMIQELKLAAKTVADSLGETTKTLKVLNQSIDDVEFVMPDKNTEILGRFRRLVGETLNGQIYSTQLLAKPNAELDQILLYTALANEEASSIENSSGDSAKAPDDKTDVEKFCARIMPKTLTDITLTAQGSISVSWYSIAYPDIGISVLAHELGHIVSARFLKIAAAGGTPTKKFSDSLSCVENRNPYNLDARKLLATQRGLWTEEDWADHFSSMVINELNKKPNSAGEFAKNLGCALIDNNLDYKNNRLDPSPGETHSADFLRLIMVGIDRGILPLECQSFTTFAADNGRELSCH